MPSQLVADLQLVARRKRPQQIPADQVPALQELVRAVSVSWSALNEWMVEVIESIEPGPTQNALQAIFPSDASREDALADRQERAGMCFGVGRSAFRRRYNGVSRYDHVIERLAREMTVRAASVSTVSGGARAHQRGRRDPPNPLKTGLLHETDSLVPSIRSVKSRSAEPWSSLTGRSVVRVPEQTPARRLVVTIVTVVAIAVLSVAVTVMALRLAGYEIRRLENSASKAAPSMVASMTGESDKEDSGPEHARWEPTD